MSYTEEIKRATGLLVIEVINSNPNGDPDCDGDPRQRFDGIGEISPVSFKRKIRDITEDKRNPVWLMAKQKLGIKDDNEYLILESRGRDREVIRKELDFKDSFINSVFVKKYWDARIFGNTFLESELGKGSIKTGVVQFGMGNSISPVDIERQTNTNKAGVEATKNQGMAPMGYRIVTHGVYCMPFFVNPSNAHKSGCTGKDIELLKTIIPYAYDHTRSAVRPYVILRHAWYCEHSNQLGSCSDFELIAALTPRRKNVPDLPSKSWEDYDVPKGLPDDLGKKVSCKDLMETA